MAIGAKKILIVGGGLTGTLMAILLARKGVQHIRILERQPAPTQWNAGNGRSFNLTISKRGELALAEAGVLEEVMADTVAISGRMCHVAGAADKFFPYGGSDELALHAIRRSRINTVLLECANRYSCIQIDYNVEVDAVCKNSGDVRGHFSDTGDNFVIDWADFVIGADGAFSAVRRDLLAGERTDYSQDFLPWGYRELHIPASSDVHHRFDNKSLHVWPRGDMMMFALPNVDGSVTGNFISRLDQQRQLMQDGVLTQLFASKFPDVARLVPNIEHKLKETPLSNFQTIRTQKWYHGDKVVLMGDSAHAIVPFYGQGMNSSFDDCLHLIEQLEKHGRDFEAAFAGFQEERKKNTDIIAALSLANFEELRSNFRTPVLQARRRIDTTLFSWFPNRWVPLHYMISHTNMSYVDAMARWRRRNRIAQFFGLDILVYGMIAVSAMRQGAERLFDKVNVLLSDRFETGSKV